MLTAKQLKGIATTGGFDTYSDELYELASALLNLSTAKSMTPYTETWTDGYDDADEVGAEWRRQMNKD